MTVFNFDRQHLKGLKAEHHLDDCFADRFEIHQVSRNDQRRGRDRVFIDRETGERKTVEYKTDWRTQDTHNVFVETVSVDSARKPGWAYTCTADLIFYYVPGEGEELVYVIEPDVIRAHLDDWKARYPTRFAWNEGYRTWGICVRQAEFERVAREVVSL